MGRRAWDSETGVVHAAFSGGWTAQRFAGLTHQSRMETLKGINHKNKPETSPWKGKSALNILRTGTKGKWIMQKLRIYGYWEEAKQGKEIPGWWTWESTKSAQEWQGTQTSRIRSGEQCMKRGDHHVLLGKGGALSLVTWEWTACSLGKWEMTRQRKLGRIEAQSLAWIFFLINFI